MWQFLLLSLLLLLFFLFIWFWRSQKLFAQLQELEKFIQKISQGEFSARLSIPKNQKIAELSKAMNALAQTLEQHSTQAQDEKLQSEALIKKLEKVRKQFVANASHELKTPLTSILGYAETLSLAGQQDPKIIREFSEKIIRKALELKELVEDILKLAQIEGGHLPLDFQPISLRGVFQELLPEFFERAAQKKIDLSSGILPAVQVQADRKALKQIIANLLSNAIHYTPEGGEIELFLYDRKDDCLISIKDTGIGIPQKDLERVFERFYRVDKGRARNQGGTGLGLAIVKHLVLAHKGKVWVESEEGQGSTFSFTLPHGL